MAMPQFTGKYASIRKDIYKGTVGAKFVQGGTNYAGGKIYKTEQGFRKAMMGVFDGYMRKIDALEKASLPARATLVISPGGRGMYGTQWSAELRYEDINGLTRYVEGERTTGTGYDKISSASASVFNKSPEFMKLLMDARAKKKTLPYGAYLSIGKPWLPNWEGGVGISSHVRILEAMGYDVSDVSTDKAYIYMIALKKKR
ncbi:MAG: hypothetical protein IIY21_06045 [Clostridiales bacterium]|nr:hypothetical protein [Clostridiales bacterium]